MGAIVFGSPEAARVRQRIAQIERLEALPLHTYEVSGRMELGFTVEVEARSREDAQDQVRGMSLRELNDWEEPEIDIWTTNDLGLAKPDDPEEQAKERARLERGAEAVPAQRLV